MEEVLNTLDESEGELSDGEEDSEQGNTSVIATPIPVIEDNSDESSDDEDEEVHR